MGQCSLRQLGKAESQVTIKRRDAEFGNPQRNKEVEFGGDSAGRLECHRNAGITDGAQKEG